jgi:hypothetical protein
MPKGNKQNWEEVMLPDLWSLYALMFKSGFAGQLAFPDSLFSAVFADMVLVERGRRKGFAVALWASVCRLSRPNWDVLSQAAKGIT